MEKPLVGKNILVVEDETVFRTVIAGFLGSLGATVHQAGNGLEALDHLKVESPDLILCDLAMPQMGGIEFVERLLIQGVKIPVLVISATDKMADIAKVLRLGVKDVLLKPIVDLNRLREAVLACLYPALFTSHAIEETELIQDWEALRKNPQDAAQLLKQLQPPAHQTIAHCRINYRQLTMVEQPGLVLDIAALSDKDLAFYCLDVTRAGDNGVLAALLLRVLFNGILQEHLAHQQQRLPQMSSLLKQVNQLLRRTHLDGQFPLLVGYYHVEQQNLILVSAGLHANVSAGKNQVQLSNGVPLGTLKTAHLNQISQRCDAWQCQVWGGGSRLRLMLSADE
ncbi:two-component system response regulator RssB [Yersinia mollaretii]|uniref:Regulator of RpoS n=2 Tax=Yersinia mollaretii TaxID=33060 RepID=A0AA36PHS6_YERMO|nr:two-component system response regulator RssB [Yersinia mollaretii]MDA5526829.1 two-component system response regulator RssB [Yersinia mollaretii]MDA5534337.1 two-component system response regulator RssB [Yersinia mollaretii]MDR7872223.1 two-component system response regulator RssB [Yersinia mollaretii]NIL02267.1 two-component system response regulator RssB [Yersinia mollaretii]PHZ31682.1 response regulator [Yersinia mollaretii]